MEKSQTCLGADSSSKVLVVQRQRWWKEIGRTQTAGKALCRYPGRWICDAAGAAKVREGWLLQPVKGRAVLTPTAMAIPSGGFCELDLLWDTCCWYCGPSSSLAPNLGDHGRLWPIFAFRAEDQGH